MASTSKSWRSYHTFLNCAGTDIMDVEVNKRIESAIARDKICARNEVKLLLLGTADCGKSTIIKQMRILHDNGFSDEEFETYRHIISTSVVLAMATLLAGVPPTGQVGNETPSTKYREDAGVVRDVATLLKQRTVDPDSANSNVFGSFVLTPALGCRIKRLWQDASLRQFFEQCAAEHQLSESFLYFFENIDRISTVNYKPTQMDLLRTRVSTLGIVETRFHIKDLLFRVIDVGGQRTQRRKWIHCFDSVTAVIYIVAISEYDQMLEENRSVNRIHESLQLFKSVINCSYFINKNFVLFLNKRDLFEAKIETVPLTVAFPKFSGRQTYDSGIAFLKRTFEEVDEGPPMRTIYTHETCGTDTNQVENVLDSTLDTILANRMKGAGFV